MATHLEILLQRVQDGSATDAELGELRAAVECRMGLPVPGGGASCPGPPCAVCFVRFWLPGPVKNVDHRFLSPRRPQGAAGGR